MSCGQVVRAGKCTEIKLTVVLLLCLAFIASTTSTADGRTGYISLPYRLLPSLLADLPIDLLQVI